MLRKNKTSSDTKLLLSVGIRKMIQATYRKLQNAFIMSSALIVLGMLLFAAPSFAQAPAASASAAKSTFPPGVVPPPDEEHASHPIGTCGTKHFEPRLEFCDTRDNRIYRYVKIGTQTWMAENLNYGKMIPGEENQTQPGQKYCFYDKESDCAALYQWHQAVGLDPSYDSKKADLKGQVQGVCPSGWHVPSAAEWDTLFAFVDKEQGADNEAQSLMYYSENDDFKWKTNTDPDSMMPTDKYGFHAISIGLRLPKGNCPVGHGNTTAFCSEHDRAVFWTSDDNSADKDPAAAIDISFSEDIAHVDKDNAGGSPGAPGGPGGPGAGAAPGGAGGGAPGGSGDGRKPWKQGQKVYGIGVRCVKN